MAFDKEKPHLNVWEIWNFPVTKSWLSWAILFAKTDITKTLANWYPTFNDRDTSEIVAEMQEQINASWNQADIETLKTFIAQHNIAV